MFNRVLLIASLFFTLQLFAESHAVIFGDSLSDEGRLYDKTHQVFPPEPFYEGRFSNGLVWAEYAFDSRENYAFGGATSGYDNYLTSRFGSALKNTGLLAQVNEYLLHANAYTRLNSAPHYIMIGGNDFLVALDDPAFDMDDFIDQAIKNIAQAVRQLELAGVTNIWLIGLPDMGMTPKAASMTPPERQLLSILTAVFNQKLDGLAVHMGYAFYDMNHLFNRMVSHADEYGLTNTADACFDEKSWTVCDNPSEYLFWDDIHPTTTVHQVVARALRFQ